MKRMILLPVVLFALSYGRAQDWFSKHGQGEAVEGYIITVTGDTLTGLILYDYPVIMQKRISFDQGKGQGTVIYQPKDIRGYSCNDRLWESSGVMFDTYQGAVNFMRFGILYHGNGPLHLIRI